MFYDYGFFKELEPIAIISVMRKVIFGWISGLAKWGKNWLKLWKCFDKFIYGVSNNAIT